MPRRQSNTLPVFVWFLGLLGCSGYLNPYGYIPLLIPIIFWLFGSRFTKLHCLTYFNALLSAIMLHVAGFVIDQILQLFKVNTFKFMYLGLIYFSIFCIFGLLAAFNNRKYQPELSLHVF